MSNKLKPNRLRTLLDGYVDREDGTILHIKTNLLWQKRGPMRVYNWDSAKQYCKKLRLGGYTDWRLPTKEELDSLIDRRYEPTISPIFQCYDEYWSSTSYADNLIYAWGVVFNLGDADIILKHYQFYVRAVRTGS